jgi:hypothetical protein
MWLPVVASAAGWGFIFWLFPPGELEFPLHDDWAFAKSAFAFAEGQGIHYYGWSSMPQLGQWIWAWPFIKILGPTFVTLRISTIVLSLFGLLALFDILRREGCAPWVASLATATVAFNPVFFALQGSFMTDVPTLSFMLIALAFFGRAAESGKLWPLAPATAAGLLAVTTRQNAIVVALAAAPIMLSKEYPRKHGTHDAPSSTAHDLRSTVHAPRSTHHAPRFVALLTIIVVGLATDYWFASRADIIRLGPAVPSPARVVLLPYFTVHLLGLAVLPVLLACARGQRFGGYFMVASFAMLLGAVYWKYYEDQLPYPWLQMDGYIPNPTEGRELGGYFPYAGGVVGIWGAFSGAMYGRPIYFGLTERLIVTLLGCLGGGALLVRQGDGRPWRSSLVSLAILQIPLLIVIPIYYDRYLLPLLPGACWLALGQVGSSGCIAEPSRPRADRWTRLWRLLGITMLLVYAGFSVALVHDCFSWNHARWALGQRAVANKIPAQAIEGGFEWDGWQSLDNPKQPSHPATSGLSLPYTRRNFPAITGQYALSFKVLPGTVALDSEKCELWLRPGGPSYSPTVYLLKPR